jgi:hypothetical protein
MRVAERFLLRCASRNPSDFPVAGSRGRACPFPSLIRSTLSHASTLANLSAELYLPYHRTCLRHFTLTEILSLLLLLIVAPPSTAERLGVSIVHNWARWVNSFDAKPVRRAVASTTTSFLLYHNKKSSLDRPPALAIARSEQSNFVTFAFFTAVIPFCGILRLVKP